MKILSKYQTLVGFVLLGAILILVNLISMREFFRLDLTKNGNYTLSEASIKTVQDLEDVMTISAFFTEGLPVPYSTHRQYVLDLLAEYDALSNKYFAYEISDPFEIDAQNTERQGLEKDVFGRVVRVPGKREQEVIALGVEPIQISVIESDQQQTRQAFMGLVIRYQGKLEVIPIVQDIGGLEKELTKRMRKLIVKKLPILGIYEAGKIEPMESLKEALGEHMLLKSVDLEQDEIALEIDALLVVGQPSDISLGALKTIDAFIYQGKNVAFWLDRFELHPETFALNEVEDESSRNSLFDMLKHYGVNYGNNLVADVNCATLNIREFHGGFERLVPVRYPLIPEVVALSSTHDITRTLAGFLLPFPSSVSLISPLAVGEVLAYSTKGSWLETAPFNTDPSRTWRSDEGSQSGPYPLAVVLEGSFSTYFEEGSNAEYASKKSRLLAVGTSAFARDQFMNEANLLFALNMVDHLLMDPSLITMRARTLIEVPIDPELSAATKTVFKYGNMIAPPLLLLIFGFILWCRRESYRKTIAKGAL